jgi:GTP-binding protein
MLPVIAIIGRPNVGKSTLFNRLTRTRDALVGDMPGLTRDRQYGEGQFDENRYILIDTGGLEASSRDFLIAKSKSKKGEAAEDIEELMVRQAWQAVVEADVVLFLVDGRAGVHPDDEKISQLLREQYKKVYLVVNKVDGLDTNLARADFYSLGLSEVHQISAEHGFGVRNLISKVLDRVASEKPEESEASKEQVEKERDKDKSISIAFIGRPNVGKSTLVNRILGEERVIVYDQPGTLCVDRYGWR